MELTRECFALCMEDVAPSMVRFVMMNGLFEMRMNVKECCFFFGGGGGGGGGFRGILAVKVSLIGTCPVSVITRSCMLRMLFFS